MTKHIFIIGILLLTFVGCRLDDEDDYIMEAPKKEDLLSVSYNQFDFKNLYDLVKNPISIDLLKKRLDAQNIVYEPLGGYEKDIFFIITDENSVYKNYRVEIQAGDVLINFDKPTAKDVRRDYVQNVIIYPLDDDKKIITDDQPKEKYKGIFDLVKNSLSEIEPNYNSSFAVITLFGRSEKGYDEFIDDIGEYNDAIAIWNKGIKNKKGDDINLTLENSSNEVNLPKVQMEYKSSFSFTPLPYGSKYRVQIMATLPKDIKKILF